MKSTTVDRLLLISAILVCGASVSFAAPVYEPITGFRPVPLFPGGSLFRHSDGSFYGVSGDVIYRITPTGDFLTFPPVPGLQYGRPLEARHLLETADGKIVAPRSQDGKLRGGNIFRFDPQTELAQSIAYLLVRTDSGLTSDRRGFLWGTTKRGGAANSGTIYKISESTGALTIMHSFASHIVPFDSTREPLLLLPSGDLWGTTTARTNSGPTIFTINAASGVYREVGRVQDDQRLFQAGPLSNDGTGQLWCTTGAGAVVKVNTATKQYSVVAEFGPPTNPQVLAVNDDPRKLVHDGMGRMWGTTSRGSRGGGSIFRIDIGSGVLTVVADFAGFYSPESLGIGELANDGAGYLWATTQHGGVPFVEAGSGAGSIIKVNIATGEITEVIDLGATGLRAPSRHLVADPVGDLWGTLQPAPGEAGGAVFKIDRHNTGELFLLGEFGNHRDANDGLFPGAALVSARDGNLWGVAGQFSSGQGTGPNGFIYNVDPVTWEMQFVLRFTGEAGANPGTLPRGPLAADPQGQLWGTAIDYSKSSGILQSFIFKIDPVTHQLRRIATLPAGKFVFGSLVYDDIDSFWGTSHDQKLFKVNAFGGELTILDKINPLYYEDRLISDGSGQLWGVRKAHSKVELDSIFKIDVRTAAITTVVTFDGVPDYPYGLCSDGKGNLWGTVGIGPLGRQPDSREPQFGYGAVFKLDAGTGKLVYSHNFPGRSNRRGGVVTAPLAFDGVSTFYGTSLESGRRSLGTIFDFTRTSFTPWFEFTGIKGDVPGAYPTSARDQPTLVRHSDGNFYGSTSSGGVLPNGRPAGAGQFYRLRFGPTPLTLAPEDVTSTSALLRATANPNGVPTTAGFEYGIDPKLDTFTSMDARQLPAGNNPKPISLHLPNLDPGQTYYFRAVARNVENAQPQRDAILSFTTAAAE